MGVEGWGISWGVVGGGGWVEGVGDSPPSHERIRQRSRGCSLPAMAAQPLVNIWSHLSLSEDGQVEQSLGELCGNHVSLGEKVSRQMSSRETQWVDKGGG